MFDPFFKLLRTHPKCFAAALLAGYLSAAGWLGLIYGGSAMVLIFFFLIVIVTGWADDDDWFDPRGPRYA